jgi:hypothetical protein
MSDDIYDSFFVESTNSQSQSQLSCQYVECCKPLVRNGKFCNLKCCNRENVRIQKIKANEVHQTKRLAYAASPRKCIGCQGLISWESFNKSGAKYCSNSCASQANNLKRSQTSRNKQRRSLLLRFNQTDDLPNRNFKEIYYSLASFKFNVRDYPGLLNLELLDKHGWYSAGGRSKKAINKDGITRDHMLSIRDGINWNIHPLLLSHPVNCRLISASENSKKNSKSLIQAAQLFESITSFTGKFKSHTQCIDLIKKDQAYIKNQDDFVQLFLI